MTDDSFPLLSILGSLFFGSICFFLLKGWFWVFDNIPDWINWKLWLMIVITWFIALAVIQIVSD